MRHFTAKQICTALRPDLIAHIDIYRSYRPAPR